VQYSAAKDEHGITKKSARRPPSLLILNFKELITLASHLFLPRFTVQNLMVFVTADSVQKNIV